MIRLLILILLTWGAYQDIKRREVSPNITAAIAVSSLYGFLTLGKITIGGLSYISPYWLHILAATGIGTAYLIKATGGADVKAGIPLLFTMTTLELYLFLMILMLAHGAIHYKTKPPAPYFVAMAAAYLAILAIEIFTG